MKPSLKNVLSVLTVLYIEKQDNVPKNIQNTLKLFFKEVIYSENIDYAVKIYNSTSPDIIISEVQLDNKSCLPLLFNIRQYNQYIPIIITSANKREEILFEAIRLHLVDFLVKPLKVEKIIFTLNNTAKYILNHGETLISFNDKFEYNYIQKTLTIHNEKHQLTKNEFRLLELLLANEGKMVTKEHIEFHIWGEEFVGESAFKSLLKRLRDKVGKDILKNKSGHGYYLD